MNQRTLAAAIGVAMAASFTASAHAVETVFEFDAEVIYSYDAGPDWAEGPAPGTAIRGRFVVDPDTPSVIPSPTESGWEEGSYNFGPFPISGPALELWIGDEIHITSPTLSYVVYNNFSGNVEDLITISSNEALIVNGVPIDGTYASITFWTGPEQRDILDNVAVQPTIDMAAFIAANGGAGGGIKLSNPVDAFPVVQFDMRSITAAPAVVPEPGNAALMLLGLAALASVRGRIRPDGSRSGCAPAP